jgi:hypothetical protein
MLVGSNSKDFEIGTFLKSLQENPKSEMDRMRPLKLVLGAKTKWVTM